MLNGYTSMLGQNPPADSKPKQVFSSQRPLHANLLAWYDQHGRHDLPWQQPRDAYRVWLSEIMLQQTQVSTVIPYFQRFIERFATVQQLALAPLDDVLALWAGLGYYTRAKNLHRTAQVIWHDYDGVFPNNLTDLMRLPGIGRSTAGAILAQAFNQFGVILDGNVRRVLIRLYALHGDPSTLHNTLWPLAEQHTPQQRHADYTQAIMDLGALVCSRSQPKCDLCPLRSSCLAYAQECVTQLPNKRISPAKPVKTSLMLIIRDAQQQILLLKRPLSGLWNGLWCLPNLESAIALEPWLKQQPWRIKQRRPLTAFRHTFSHFHLDIDCLLLDIESTAAWQINDSGLQQWFPAAAALQLGIPAPVKKILMAI